MNYRPRIAYLLAVFAVAPVQANAESLRLEPRSSWVLDYANERCSLIRSFGSSNDTLALRIDSFGSWRSYRILVLGSEVPETQDAFSEFAFRLTPDVDARPTTALNGKVGALPAASFPVAFAPFEDPEVYSQMSAAEQVAYMATPRHHDPDVEKLVDSIELAFSADRVVALALGNMAKPLEAMRACVDNLQKTWGLDPAIEKGLRRRAVPKASTVRNVQRRYPSAMLRAGMNAHVPVRVMVDEAGRATACIVQIEGVEEAFKDAVCDGLAPRYEPALDANGRPVASMYQTAVVYQIAS